MKQYARQKCACGELARVTQTASPYEFKVVCEAGHVRNISWAHNEKPPEFVTLGAAKLNSTNNKPRGRKPGQQKPPPEWAGRRRGDLEILEYAGSRDGRHWWRCKCLSTMRTGSECGNTRIVDTAALNKVGGRRCKACNQYLLQQRVTERGKWIYKNRKTATAKG